jgi:hypothetical protein
VKGLVVQIVKASDEISRQIRAVQAVDRIGRFRNEAGKRCVIAAAIEQQEATDEICRVLFRDESVGLPGCM